MAMLTFLISSVRKHPFKCERMRVTRHATFASELDFGQIAKRGNAVYVERVVTFSTSVEPILALYTFLTHLKDVVISTNTITSTVSDQMQRMLIKFTKMNPFW